MVEHSSSIIPTAPISDEISDAVILHTSEDNKAKQEKPEEKGSTNPFKAVLEASSQVAHRIRNTRKGLALAGLVAGAAILGPAAVADAAIFPDQPNLVALQGAVPFNIANSPGGDLRNAFADITVEAFTTNVNGSTIAQQEPGLIQQVVEQEHLEEETSSGPVVLNGPFPFFPGGNVRAIQRTLNGAYGWIPGQTVYATASMSLVESGGQLSLVNQDMLPDVPKPPNNTVLPTGTNFSTPPGTQLVCVSQPFFGCVLPEGFNPAPPVVEQVTRVFLIAPSRFPNRRIFFRTHQAPRIAIEQPQVISSFARACSIAVNTQGLWWGGNRPMDWCANPQVQTNQNWRSRFSQAMTNWQSWQQQPRQRMWNH